MHVAILQVATHKYPEALVSARTAAEIFTNALSAANWKNSACAIGQWRGAGGHGRLSGGRKATTPPASTRSWSDDAGAVPMYRVLVRRYVEDLYRRWGRPQDARRYAAGNNHPPAELAHSPAAALLTAK